MRITCVGMHRDYIRGLMMADSAMIGIAYHSLLLMAKLCALTAIIVVLVLALPFALYDWMRNED